MARQSAALAKRNDSASGRFVEDTKTGGVMKGIRRDILFPTEPSTIGRKKIDRAVEQVVSRKKK